MRVTQFTVHSQKLNTGTAISASCGKRKTAVPCPMGPNGNGRTRLGFRWLAPRRLVGHESVCRSGWLGGGVVEVAADYERLGGEWHADLRSVDACERFVGNGRSHCVAVRVIVPETELQIDGAVAQ